MAGSETQPEARILDIQRMSTEDGPGLRTTVFFKGCNLSCPWCHNPESISGKPGIVWHPRKCIGCNICQSACPERAVSRDANGIRFDRSRCRACFACVAQCPNAAIELKGNTMPVEKLAALLMKDRAYFGKDGGVTLSGGEAMIQHEAALALARRLGAEGIGVALDTAGCYDFKLLQAMLPFVDLVLYDIKIFDNAAHTQIIGVDNALILKNYRLLAEAAAAPSGHPVNAGNAVRVWIRTPIIKGATDSEENIAAIGSFIAGAKFMPERWELCAFNNLCRDKYERLDMEWAYRDTGLTKRAHIEGLTKIAAGYVPGAAYTGAVTE